MKVKKVIGVLAGFTLGVFIAAPVEAKPYIGILGILLSIAGAVAHRKPSPSVSVEK